LDRHLLRHQGLKDAEVRRRYTAVFLDGLESGGNSVDLVRDLD
jgi:hypothetical protein